MNHTISELTFEVFGGRKIAIKHWQPDKVLPNSPVILALHGWLDNANTFDKIAPHLPYELYSMDFPGHGHSDHRAPGEHYHMLDYTHDIAQWVSTQTRPVILLGHSMGAGVSMLVAAAMPDNIERCILLEGIGPMVNVPEKATECLQKSVEQILKKAQSGGSRVPVYASEEEAIERRFKAGQGSAFAMSLEAVNAIALRGLKPCEGGVTWRTDPRLKLSSPSYLTKEQLLNYAKNIQCPVMMIMADPGIGFVPEQVEAVVEAIKPQKYLTLPGGHHCHLESQHQSIAKEICEFLA